jgi:hypothetical protein
MITKEQAKVLRYRDEVFYAIPQQGKPSPERHIVTRVAGVCQTWVTLPQKFRVPVRIGFNGHSEINEGNASAYHLPDQCICRQCAK